MAGRFITFEGIDGAGKSTHIDAVAARLRRAGTVVLCTREPGGTPLGERLREELLRTAMDALSEVLLVFAARREHIVQVIAPALARGESVLCDRFTDATFAYQGGGRGFDIEALGRLEDWVQQGLQPDLTLWFDLPANVAAARRGAARAPDRFEAQDETFFKRVIGGYRTRAQAHPARFERIDALQAPQAVAEQIAAVLQRRGW